MTDNPIVDAAGDRFGFSPYARVLCSAIEQANPLPLVVGVLGPWGSGKSSFLNICRDLLRKREIAAVSFNPWKYDQKDEIWHALLQALLAELKAMLEREQTADEKRKVVLAEAKETVVRLSKAAAWLLARRAITPLTGGFIQAADIDELADIWATRDGIEYRHINQFETDFATLVRDYTGGKRLVVLVDDLDRCQPATAVTVLDSLKLFMSEAPCVFILAMDLQAVERSVAQRLDIEPHDAQRYLEKLIQLPYHLPTASFESVFEYAQSNLRALQEDPAMWEIIRLSSGGNPRRACRFVSAINLTEASMRLHSSPTRKKLIHAAQLLVLRSEHADFFERICADPSVWEERLNSPDPGNTSLDRLLHAWSPERDSYEFPAPPTFDEIRSLTEVIAVTGGILTGLDNESDADEGAENP